MDSRSDEDRKTPEEGGGAARNWLELPCDVTAEILLRLGVVDVLTSAQYVCATWRGICRDPSMWRHVDMLIPKYKDPDDPLDYVRLCRLAVVLSQGGLISIGIDDFADDDLLLYIVERSCRLRHLQLTYCFRVTEEGLISVAAQVPFLEKLELTMCDVTKEAVEVFARSCPLLLSFKSKLTFTRGVGGVIAQGMPQLIHLKLGEDLTNVELMAILDGCPGLESLDLFGCYGLNLDRELGQMCVERIKEFRGPYGPYVPPDDNDSSSSDGEFEDED